MGMIFLSCLLHPIRKEKGYSVGDKFLLEIINNDNLKIDSSLKKPAESEELINRQKVEYYY